MRRTTLSLPDNVVAAMDREARRRSVSRSHVAREALEERYRLNGERPRELSFIGIGRSDSHGPDAADMEEAMAREWTDPRDS